MANKARSDRQLHNKKSSPRLSISAGDVGEICTGPAGPTHAHGARGIVHSAQGSSKDLLRILVHYL